jgi:hypothetical protein
MPLREGLRSGGTQPFETRKKVLAGAVDGRAAKLILLRGNA